MKSHMRVRALCEGAVLVAVAQILSYLKLWEMPWGGSVVLSMIPLVLLIALYAIIREPLVNLMDVPKDMIDTVAGITGIANTGAYPQIYMAEA